MSSVRNNFLKFCAIAAVMLLAVTNSQARNIADIYAVDHVSRAFDGAQYRKDRSMLDHLLAKNMVYIRGSGEKVGREAFLAAFSDPSEQFEPFVITDRQLVQLGSGVVAVTANGTIRGSSGEGRFQDHFRFTDIFSHRKGRWQVTYVQVSRITDK